MLANLSAVLLPNVCPIAVITEFHTAVILFRSSVVAGLQPKTAPAILSLTGDMAIIPAAISTSAE
jgi:hypothetical protein